MRWNRIIDKSNKNRGIILNFSGIARGTYFFRYSTTFFAAVLPLKYAGGIP